MTMNFLAYAALQFRKDFLKILAKPTPDCIKDFLKHF